MAQILDLDAVRCLPVSQNERLEVVSYLIINKMIKGNRIKVGNLEYR